MTLPGDFYEQSYPPSVYGGGGTPEPPSPTTAVAGTPGHYLPAGAVVPPNGAAFAGLALTASPTTAWTTGQYVPLGDGGQRHWNGTAWVVGPAL